MFGNCSPTVQEIAFQYGRNIGMAFQVPVVKKFFNTSTLRLSILCKNKEKKNKNCAILHARAK